MMAGMGHPAHILTLLAVMALMHAGSSKTIIQPGGTFIKSCRLSVKNLAPEDRIVQFFRDRTEAKIFRSTSSTSTLRVISNDTDVDPLITAKTDRYSVTNGTDGSYVLEIKNLTDSDSAWYGCRIYDKVADRIPIELSSTELQVPGPLRGLFWTSNYTAHMTNAKDADSYTIKNGSVALVDNEWFGSRLACAVLVSNVEPRINITIGKPGEEGSVDITNQFETRSSSVVTINEAGIRYRSKELFVKSHQFRKTSIRDLYCTSSLYGVKFESVINVQIISKPGNKPCSPFKFYALEGAKNVDVTCLVPAHPYAEVNWIIQGYIKVNESSPQPSYTVTNKEQLDGVLSTLTIAEVTRSDFHQFGLEAVNSEGSGHMYLQLEEGEEPSSSGPRVLSGVSSLGFFTAFSILLWITQ